MSDLFSYAQNAILPMQPILLKFIILIDLFDD